jgi:NDP-mannose synthase
LRIEYVVEIEPMGTAGSLNLVTDLDETFLVMNGDLLTTIDYASVVASHRAEEHSATVVLARRDVPIDYGVVYVDEQGCLERYEEKPTLHHFVSTGIYALNRSAVARVPQGRFDMPDLVTTLIAAGEAVQCHITDEYWQDIGRFEDYQRASADFVQDPERFLPFGSTRTSS